MSHLPILLEQFLKINIIALKTMFTDPLSEFIKDMDKFQQMVEQTIDLDSAEKGDFLVRPEFDDELKGTYKNLSKNIYYIYLYYMVCYMYKFFYINLYLLIISINIRIKMYYG